MDLGLFLEDVQPYGPDFAAVQGFDEGGFVHHGATRSVDDDDAVFHFGEFGFADYVAGVFLQRRI